MIYREYGLTGKSVSVLGFGGMRFDHIDQQDECVELMVRAAKGGINYFDTAPGYFGTKSEEVYGLGLAELRRQGHAYHVSTKTFQSEPDAIRREIETQLTRLNVSAIDFYHIWCITDLANWEVRKKNGVLDTFRKLKEEGLIRHICVSSHLTGDDIKVLLLEGVFEGVLFGYSAYNFQTRAAAFDAIRAKRLGAIIMNPLGGGIIPQHPELFQGLVTRPGETVTQAALRFLFAHKDLTTALVGFSNMAQLDEALGAVEDYREVSEAELEVLKARVTSSFEGVCTGCGYCDTCPQDIAIPKYMDAWNQRIFTGKDEAVTDRLKWHWGIPATGASACISCGQCETACTQHLPIIERLAAIAAL
jgi:predicted aldo/keto reductase-like oxidoreductase